MPPEVPDCPCLVTSSVQFFSPASPESKLKLNLPFSGKHCRGTKRMNVTARKLIPIVVFFLSSISVLRFIRITITTTSSPLHALPPTLGHTCSSPTCNKAPSSHQETSANMLTEKEFRFLSKLITSKAPCNLLFFGFEPQYLVLSTINAGGVTIFLENDPHKISTIEANSNTSKVYKVEHQTPAKEAYKLLQHARENPGCRPGTGLLIESTCQLALRNLPREVHENKWDVVMVDGPNADKPESPGRMEAIYTASMLARAGGTTNVVVHDVDRMIERWFSWEFLCDENLVSSKGRLWNFRISGLENSTRFCSPTTPSVQQYDSSLGARSMRV